MQHRAVLGASSIPMATEMGFGMVPWSPLAKGVQRGKYGRNDLGALDVSLDDEQRTRFENVSAISLGFRYAAHGHPALATHQKP